MLTEGAWAVGCGKWEAIWRAYTETVCALRLLCLDLEDGQAGDGRQGAKDEGCTHMSLRNCCLRGGWWDTTLCSGCWCLLSLSRVQTWSLARSWILVSAGSWSQLFQRCDLGQVTLFPGASTSPPGNWGQEYLSMYMAVVRLQG